MKILTTSWRRSLAAAALLAFAGSDSNGLADDTQGGPVEVAVDLDVEDGELSDDVLELDVDVEAIEDQVKNLELDVEAVHDQAERSPIVVEEHEVVKKGKDQDDVEVRRVIVTRDGKKLQVKKPRVRPDRESDTLKKKLSQLQGRAKQLRLKVQERQDDDLRRKQLEETRRAIADTRARLAPDRGRQDRGDTPDHEDLPSVLNSTTLRYLKTAIINLHYAGLHDQAEQLSRQVDQQMERQRLARRGYVPENMPRDTDAVRRDEQLEQAVHELRAQLDQLRQEMHEVRNVVHEALERLERNEARHHDPQADHADHGHADHNRGREHGDEDLLDDQNREHSADQ